MNSQITFVVQKTREIGMLKALGATRGARSFGFSEPKHDCGPGGRSDRVRPGDALAHSYRNEFLHFMNRMTGFELFPAKIYSLPNCPL